MWRKGARRGAVGTLAAGPRAAWWGPPPVASPFRGRGGGGMRAPHILCACPARRGPRAGSARGMAKLAEEYEARAAIFRRLAGELKNEDDRAALLAIAEDYEAEAARLKPKRP